MCNGPSEKQREPSNRERVRYEPSQAISRGRSFAEQRAQDRDAEDSAELERGFTGRGCGGGALLAD